MTPEEQITYEFDDSLKRNPFPWQEVPTSTHNLQHKTAVSCMGVLVMSRLVLNY